MANIPFASFLLKKGTSMRHVLSSLLIGMLLVTAILGEASSRVFTGTYTVTTEGSVETLQLRQENDGQVKGSITTHGYTVPLSGRVTGDRIDGTFTLPGESTEHVQFRIRWQGSKLVLKTTGTGEEAEDGSQSMVFTRQRATTDRPAAAPHHRTEPHPATPGDRAAVRVNGVRLEAAMRREFECRYHVRILPGDYWYDRVSGAWGRQGGPALGCIAAGLKLGGPLRRDASGGNTGVFVNGRELHRMDVAALQQVVQVSRGRFWVDSQGNFGYEGGVRLGNLVALAQARRAPRQGILSTYDRVGAVVIGPGS
jgi:hypothetical protein